MILDLFPDLATKLICSADGDPVEPPAGGDAGGAAAGTPPPAEPAASAPAEPEPYTPDWRDREIAAKHRQLKDREQQIEQFRAENEQLKRLAEAAARGEPPVPRPSPPPAPPPYSDVEVEQRAQQRAAEIVAKDQAASLDAALRATNSAEEYATILRNFSSLEGAFDILFHDIMATDEGPYVTAVLGRNPEEIQRIRDLPTARRQNALMRIALEKPKPGAAPVPTPPVTRPSGAPPPPSANPPGGSVLPVESANLYDERYDFKNYYAGNDHVNVEKDRDAAWYTYRAREKLNSVGRIWSPGNRSGIGGRTG